LNLPRLLFRLLLGRRKRWPVLPGLSYAWCRDEMIIKGVSMFSLHLFVEQFV
jgi:hypothetical protein